MLEAIKNNIVCKIINKEDKTESGILLPVKKEKSDIAIVINVGCDVKEIKADDKIIYNDNFKEVTFDNEKYIIIKEEDVLAIVK